MRVGATGGIPSPLVVRLSRAAEAETVVTLASADEAIATVPASVTFAIGEAVKEIDVVGVAVGSAVITATVGPDSVTGLVTVLAVDAPVQIAAAAPTSLSLLLGQTVSVELILDLPAPAGTTITLTTTGTTVTIPATVSVTDDDVRASFDVVAAAVGTTTIVAKIGAAGDEVEIDVVVAEAPSNVDLSGFIVTRAGPTSNGTFTLPPNTVVPINGYVVLSRDAPKAAFETAWATTLGADVVFIGGSGNLIVVNAKVAAYSLKRGATVIDGPTIASLAPNTIQRTMPVAAAGLETSWSVLGNDAATPGSGQAAAPVAASGCYISEVSDADAFANEFLEIHCNGALAN